MSICWHSLFSGNTAVDSWGGSKFWASIWACFLPDFPQHPQYYTHIITVCESERPNILLTFNNVSQTAFRPTFTSGCKTDYCGLLAIKSRKCCNNISEMSADRPPNSSSLVALVFHIRNATSGTQRYKRASGAPVFLSLRAWVTVSLHTSTPGRAGCFNSVRNYLLRVPRAWNALGPIPRSCLALPPKKNLGTKRSAL